MKNKTLAFILSATLLIGLSSGCTGTNQKIEQYSKDKELCPLNPNTVTQFTYKEKNYTILNSTVEEAKLGNWVGYIRKFAVIDAKGKILLQQDTEKGTVKTLTDFADRYPDAVSVIPFLNVYEAKDGAETELVVDANDKYYKAIQTDKKRTSDQVFDYRQDQGKALGENFTVSSKNCTQLLRCGNVYQVTDQVIPEEQIGKYLDVIAQSIIFDGKTKLQIPKEDLQKVDWDGKNSGKQQRENWTYGEVHAIQNTDVSKSIAVEIDSEYRLAIRS